MPSVLLIDDDAMSRELFALLLEAEGYSVRACKSGDDALVLLKKEKLQPDAVLSDLQMPGTSGAALAEALRTLCPKTALLGMSASGNGVAGYDGFLRKPFDGAQFTEALDSLSSKGSASSVAPQTAGSVDLDEARLAPLAAAMPPSQLGELFAMALADARKRAGAMRASLAAGDDDAFRKAAHAIKGSAAMLGASAMAEAARSLEDTGITADASRQLDELFAAAERLEGILLQRFPAATQ